MNKQLILAAALLCASAAQTNAGTKIDKVCSWRLSVVFGGTQSAAIAGSGAAMTAAGLTAKAAGLYTLTHSVTGLTMVGSTAAGASAAGTTGIIAGTGGVVGSIVAFITAPATLIAGAVVGIGVSAHEGACFFTDERITDFHTVLSVVRHISDNADPNYFSVKKDPVTDNWIMSIRDDDEKNDYDVSNLYVVNGTLMHRDWFKNTVIGKITPTN